MPEIKQIQMPSGTTYDIVDQGARDLIAQISPSGASWLGITTTALKDGDTTNPITINGVSIAAVAGNITSYQSKEFIFNGNFWQEFGDLDSLDLGDLANTNLSDLSIKSTAETSTASKVSFTVENGVLSLSSSDIEAITEIKSSLTR